LKRKELLPRLLMMRVLLWAWQRSGSFGALDHPGPVGRVDGSTWLRLVEAEGGGKSIAELSSMEDRRLSCCCYCYERKGKRKKRRKMMREKGKK
jgi:hypothetical protein